MRFHPPMPNVSETGLPALPRHGGSRSRSSLALMPPRGARIFPAYSQAVDRLAQRIHENGGGENAPRPGEAMPPFLLPDETGRLVGLPSLLAEGPVAVMFFRGHWCPYCRLDMSARVIGAMDRIKSVGRPGRCDHAGDASLLPAKFKTDSAASVSGPDRPRQWLCALSLNLAIWLGTEIERLLSHDARYGELSRQ